MKLSLAIQTPEVPMPVPVCFFTGTFEERLAKAANADAGADGVEFMTSDPASLDAAAIRGLLLKNGLEAAAVGSGAMAFAAGLTLLNPDAEKAKEAKKRAFHLVDFAAGIGAPIVTVGSFRGWLKSAGEGGRGQLTSILREIAGYAESRGVRIAIEPLNRYESDIINNAAEGLAFVGEVGHPACGLLLDTYHVNIEESSWVEPFRLLMDAGRLWHVHLGDNNRLPPGRGMIDFAGIVALLREIGYDGYLSAELLAKPDPDTAARQTIEYMRSILEVRR